MDKFIDPIDSMTIERHVQLSTRFNGEQIIRKFPKEWDEYKFNLIGPPEEVEGDYEIYEDDVVEFLLQLVDDLGCEVVFGKNRWDEELTDLEIWG